jgi:hypothetical protein
VKREAEAARGAGGSVRAAHGTGVGIVEAACGAGVDVG